MRNIFFAAGEKIIKAQQTIATSNKFVAQVRPQKSSAASDKYLFNFFLQIKKRQRQALLLITQAIRLIGR